MIRRIIIFTAFIYLFLHIHFLLFVFLHHHLFSLRSSFFFRSTFCGQRLDMVADQYIDKQKLAAPVDSCLDSGVNKYLLLPEFLKVRGLVKQHLDSFNYFINTGIKKIVRANDRIVSSIDPSIYLRFKDVRIGQPSETLEGISEDLAPHACRLSDKTYVDIISLRASLISAFYVLD
ncbi:RNA_pol_Rpb2_1 domain-containing protein [Cephalotus follicularis]|uniref:DNA-directed RNA polymerase n=1 Tax=Cephalotus follicularis TaxID=3775 RepID=A0A1Q3B3T6_CEPFO|nr:RNA_pol_Rpb2_1 domain-containing protein [Cephalotus follicularis]